MDIRYQPTIQIRSKSVLLYNTYIGDRLKKHNSSRQLFAQSRFSDHSAESEEVKKTYSGDMTTHARKRLARAVSLLNQSSPWQKVPSPVDCGLIDFKLSFITLTIPKSEPLTGKEAYEYALKPFIRAIKIRYPGFIYVYKAELQERGQVHYHMTSNTCIPHTVVREVWNKILSSAGYMVDYIAEHGHNNAPSTEIKAVQNIADIESYLVKYISKADGLGRSLNGKVWGCSKRLQGRGYFSEVFNSVNMAALEQLEKAKKVIVKAYDRFSIVKFKESSPLVMLSKEQLSSYTEFIDCIKKGLPYLHKKFKESIAEVIIEAKRTVYKLIINSQLTLFSVDRLQFVPLNPYYFKIRRRHGSSCARRNPCQIFSV